MGLFGFGKKKDKAAETNNDNLQNEAVKNNASESAVKTSGNGGNESNDDNNSGGFVGFVLMSEPEWDKEQLANDLKAEWGIKIPKDALNGAEKYKDIILFNHENLMIAITFIPAPVPADEVEHYAKANYMWKDAVEAAKSHKAQLLVAIMGGETDQRKRGRMFAKVVSSCLNQKHAIGVYADGAVYEKKFYREAAEMAKNNGLPVLNLVWFGIYRDEKQAGIYTYGLKKFGKDEIEVYVTPENGDFTTVDFNGIRAFLFDIAAYVIDSDVVLRDGETIGFTAEQKLPITKSKGLALDGETLKIVYDNK